MNAKNIIEDAINNITTTSEALDKFCSDPKNYNSYGAHLIEQMSWELYKQANTLREFQAYGGS